MGKRSPGVCGSITKFTWACANASGCFINWICGIACRVPQWEKPIRRARPSIKKTPSVGARPGHRSRGLGRGAFLPAWLALPDVGALGDRGSGAVALSWTQERGLFRGGALARWPGFVPTGNWDVRGRNVLAFLAALALGQRRKRANRDRHHRQRQI